MEGAQGTECLAGPADGVDEALRQIEHDRGDLLDPDAVDACLRLFREGRFAFEARP